MLNQEILINPELSHPCIVPVIQRWESTWPVDLKKRFVTISSSTKVKTLKYLQICVMELIQIKCKKNQYWAISRGIVKILWPGMISENFQRESFFSVLNPIILENQTRLNCSLSWLNVVSIQIWLKFAKRLQEIVNTSTSLAQIWPFKSCNDLDHEVKVTNT